jgi:hypothetical protein
MVSQFRSLRPIGQRARASNVLHCCLTSNEDPNLYSYRCSIRLISVLPEVGKPEFSARYSNRLENPWIITTVKISCQIELNVALF